MKTGWEGQLIMKVVFILFYCKWYNSYSQEYGKTEAGREFRVHKWKD